MSGFPTYQELTATDATEPLGVCGEASVSSSQLKPVACMEVMHNRSLSHESIVNPLVLDCRQFGPSIGAMVIENELPTNGRDGSGVPDHISADTLKFFNIGFTRKL